ncbi:serum response factor homolog B-like [Ctenocephalides felis]|uniref:serum response factor homolog B-like n=1 Tax=Ctenocephalides felis TaxID=7515 RepID=UPI000E6E46DE|nr:serum response factor homolog B-like [Ctenocephalides felis]
MSQNLLQDILQGFVNEENLYRWLISDVTDNVLSATYNCTKTDFIFYYLNFVRSQTNRFLKNDENPNESNDRSRNYTGSTHFSNSAHDSNTSLLQNESYIEEGTNIQEKNIIGSNKIIHNSLHIDNAFNENAFSPVPHSGNTKLNESSGSVYFSTPNDQKKRNNSISSKSYSKSQKSIERVSINFGDYIQNASSKKHKHHSANKSRSINTSNEKSDLTCSVDQNTTENSYCKDITGTPESSRSNLDSQFPALGERLSFQKSNSVSKINRSKRIKPTSLNFSDCDINKSDSIKTSFNDINERQQNCNSSSNNFQMERSILRNEKDFIKKQFENSKHIKTIFINPKEKSTVVKVSDPGDILQVTRRKELDILANIYNVILNNNLVVNFFSELNFIFSLLNVEKIDDQTDNSDLFPTFHNSETIFYSA